MCHCLACQRRTGSAFGIQARFPSSQVRVVGRHREYVRISDEGEERTFHFCPACGATVFYTLAAVPDVVAVPIGAFAEPTFPPPTISVFESRRHPWLAFAMAVFLLSMAGIPPTAGFAAKYLLFYSAIQAGETKQADHDQRRQTVWQQMPKHDPQRRQAERAAASMYSFLRSTSAALRVVRA